MLRIVATVGVALCVQGQARAQQVQFNGTLGSSKAVLVIDGQLHTVAVGATVRGVTLRRLGADEAVVVVGGEPRTVRLGESPVSLGGSGTAGGGREIVLPVGAGGHVVTEGSINGRPARFMVDTGATQIAMGAADAERLGLKYDGGRRGMASTAGGMVPMYEVTLRSVRIGDVELNNLTAGVVQAAMPHILLGNNFLSRFRMRREGDIMRLEKLP